MTRLATVIALLFATRLFAQEFPSPQPDEHHDLLAKEAGTWDADIKMFFQGPDGPASEFKGVEKIEMVSGGLFSKSSFTSKFGDREFEGHGLFGWDPQKKQYTGLWVDNFNTAPTAMTGSYDAQKKQLTFHSTVAGPGGNPTKMRQVTSFVDENTRRFETFMTLGQGDQAVEVKLMEITSKKRP